jgi:pimeloyl-ACP methyl ester carboxylesterase
MKLSQIDVGGAELQVAETGHGRAVLFCHGFPAIWSVWRSQMLAAADAGWRAIAPDMRGYGGSSAPASAEAYTPFDTVGDLVGLLDRLEIPSAVVVGHDFGANVAWNAAMMRPDRFSAVFGLSAPFRSLRGPSFLEQLRLAGKHDFYMFAQMRPEAEDAWADAATTIPGVYYWTSGQAPDETRWDPFDRARGLLRRAPEPLRTIDPTYIAEAINAFSRTGFRGGLNYYRAIDPFFARARAFAGATIRQPSYFLTGSKDGLNRVSQPSETALLASLSDLRGFQMLEGVGHWPQLEAEEQVNEALLSFLAGL